LQDLLRTQQALLDGQESLLEGQQGMLARLPQSTQIAVASGEELREDLTDLIQAVDRQARTGRLPRYLPAGLDITTMSRSVRVRPEVRASGGPTKIGTFYQSSERFEVSALRYQLEGVMMRFHERHHLRRVGSASLAKNALANRKISLVRLNAAYSLPVEANMRVPEIPS
jgi:hypothetical protein